MSIREITRPLPGERVVALSPEDAAAAATTWLRRPNLFPGRALTAPTLEARSQWAAGRVAQRGQAFTAGVVRGLDVGFVTGTAEEGEDRPPVTLYLAAGRGLATSGEDVALARELTVDLWALPVVAPPAVLEGGGFGGGGVVQPRAVGPSLGELVDGGEVTLPRAGILVLQPARLDKADIDPDDPCDRCGCDDGAVGFEDWRLADATRLLWYAWPEDWRPLPPAGPLFRNRVAWSVFDGEAALPPGGALPWEELGVAVALLGMDGDFLPAFVDRAAVARQGGRARHPRLRLAGGGGPGLTLAPDARLPALWQARIEQLAGQVAEMGEPAPDPADLAAAFGRLPPFGLLPRNVVDLEAFSSDFFPSSFDLDAVPIPMEQLDLALRDAAGLAPLDMAGGERVRVLVPVSQASYEPRLLMTEVLDPEFQATLDRFIGDRTRALAGRQAIRWKSAVLLDALRGEATPPPDIGDDPEAVEPESIDGWIPEAVTGGHRLAAARGPHAVGFAGATETLTPGEGESLYAWVFLDPDLLPRELMLEWRRGTAAHRAYWGEDLIDLGTDGRTTRLRQGDLPSGGGWVRLSVPAADLEYEGSELDGIVFRLFDGHAAFGPTGRSGGEGETPWFGGALPDGAEAVEDTSFDFLYPNELLAPMEARSGVVPDPDDPDNPYGVSEALENVADDPRLTSLLSDAEQGELDERGLDGFIAYLRSRADRADDLVDYAFLKVQTDVYRVRQLILGTVDATRLAVSPSLAGIAKAETAVASQERISTFFDELKTSSTAKGTAKAASTAAAEETAGSAAVSQPAPLGTATMVNLAVTGVPLAGSTFLSAGTFGGGFGGAPGGATALPGATVLEGPSGFTLAGGTPTLQGATLTRGLTGTDLVGLATLAQPIVKTTTYTPVDVKNATPLIGNFEVRTLSVAERLQLPKTQEARDYATGSRHEAVMGLVRLADLLMKEDGGEMPGLFEDIDVWGLAEEEFLPAPPAEGTPGVEFLRRPLKDFIQGTSKATLLAQLLKPPVHENDDEARYFSVSADLADRTVALLRQVEGRVKRYREAIAACETARGEVLRGLDALSLRERAWAEVLGEARHDVAVTRALIAEEQDRLDGINARRADVLEREVRFLAYMRPRDADDVAAAPSRVLDPGLLEAPVPACLREAGDVPDELRDLLRVVREAPADWFRVRTTLLDGLDRVDFLLEAVRTAQLRAVQARDQAPVAVTAVTALSSLSGLTAAIANVHVQQEKRVSAPRALSLQVDVARLATLTWKGVRAEAARVVSLGDLIDGRHGKGSVARDAAGLFERIGRMAGCLHAGFSRVLPSIRLDWAEILSQFDRAPRLRNLSNLPRWPEIEYEERRRLQAFVDWLFDQVDPGEGEAASLMDDVVRMCVLLASHAPVGRIVAGRLPRPMTVRPGVRIPLQALEPAKLRVGMQALVYKANAVVARAVVEDLGTGEVQARVIQTSAAQVELDEGVKVHFSAAGAVSLAASFLKG